MIKEVKQELRNFIISNREADAIEQLVAIFSNQPDTRNELLIIHADFNGLISESRKGIIGDNEASIKRNKIRNSILSIIDAIKDEAAIVYDLKNTIYAPILIISKSAEEEKQMRTIFANHKYRFLEYAVGDACLSVEKMKDYKLLVYNNFPEEEKGVFPILLKNHIELCQSDRVNIPLLYFGPFLRELNTEYRDTVYYANSKFSIHSRIAELLTYLNYTNSHSAS